MVVEMMAQVRGYKAFVAASGWDVLVQPEMDDVLESARKRVVDRPGKGLGARVNSLTPEVRTLGMTVETTLVWPRTKGTSWGNTNVRVLRSVIARAMEKAIGRMTARWAAGGSE